MAKGNKAWIFFTLLSPSMASAVAALIAVTAAAVVHRIAAAVALRATRGIPVLHAVVQACVPVARVLLPWRRCRSSGWLRAMRSPTSAR